MIDLKSMALTMPEVPGHPNRRAFTGVLTMVEVASERAPSGAKGHRVVLTKMAAEAALPSLLGMALDYSPSLDRHDVRRKVGVITRADIVGENVELGGYLFARDFPEIVDEIAKSDNEELGRFRSPDPQTGASANHAGNRCWQASREITRNLPATLLATASRLCGLARTMEHDRRQAKQVEHEFYGRIRAETCMGAGKSGLGLSYEVTDVKVVDVRDPVWRLAKVTFTGAAILRRDKAAYGNTWIELV